MYIYIYSHKGCACGMGVEKEELVQLFVLMSDLDPSFDP
jgi:hypothetical protein